jgi:histidinol-phosphatase (PHP family)
VEAQEAAEVAMALFSFHGCHSAAFCRHAVSPLADMVARAVELGFTHLGVSEHAPRYRAGDLFEDESDLTPADLQAMFEAYRVEARRLQAAYADRLALFVGFESEMLPPTDWAQRTAALLDGGRFDYVVGSVHNVGDVWIDYKPRITAQLAERMGGPTAMQRAYFAAVAEMVSTLRPQVVGHIDLIRKFDGPAPQFAAEVQPAIEGALEAVREAGAALDVNAAPARSGFGPVYPLPTILRQARRMGIRVTLGDDSHGVADVGVGLEACLKAIAEAGYDRVSCLARADGGDGVAWRDVPLEEARA